MAVGGSGTTTSGGPIEVVAPAMVDIFALIEW